MRLLLDTHVVLWHLAGTRAISTEARAAIRDADEIGFSVISFAEVGIKAAVGKLSVPPDLHVRIISMGVRIVALAPEHGLGVGELPMHHRDPFDRLLIAQARAEGLTMITADKRFLDYELDAVIA